MFAYLAIRFANFVKEGIKKFGDEFDRELGRVPNQYIIRERSAGAVLSTDAASSDS